MISSSEGHFVVFLFPFLAFFQHHHKRRRKGEIIFFLLIISTINFLPFDRAFTSLFFIFGCWQASRVIYTYCRTSCPPFDGLYKVVFIMFPTPLFPFVSWFHFLLIENRFFPPIGTFVVIESGSLKIDPSRRYNRFRACKILKTRNAIISNREIVIIFDRFLLFCYI